MAIRQLICVLAIVVMTPPTSADLLLEQAAGRYVIEVAGSRISFSVSQVGGGGIKGVFKTFSGTFDINRRDIERSDVSITVDPGSVDTTFRT